MLPDKKKRKKNFKKVFGKSDKVSTFAVPSARKGERKRNKGRKARDKAEARCGGGEFFKILIM
ncbi:hypothetical protein GCM10023173_01380 [Sphingobacterium thermophilum]|uniref:Uncharacterized protein n=1 Tax=Sphingobacterium thermophilum TaxID=768534 RepID=A0ABP8QSH0_9SPHI